MTPAIIELERAGVAFSRHEYEHADDRRDFGLEAVDRLGLDPDQVFKTLVVTVEGAQAVAIVPVSCTLALKAVARALGARRAEMCDPATAERITGYVRGGISPFGQKRPAPTFVDEWATALDVVHCSGGRRGLEVAVAPEAFATALDATFAAIAAW